MGLYVQAMLYPDEKSPEIGEIQEQNNRKAKRKKQESKEKGVTMLLLCLTFILQPV